MANLSNNNTIWVYADSLPKLAEKKFNDYPDMVRAMFEDCLYYHQILEVGRTLNIDLATSTDNSWEKNLVEAEKIVLDCQWVADFDKEKFGAMIEVTLDSAARVAHAVETMDGTVIGPGVDRWGVFRNIVMRCNYSGGPDSDAESDADSMSDCSDLISEPEMEDTVENFRYRIPPLPTKTNPLAVPVIEKIKKWTQIPSTVGNKTLLSDPTPGVVGHMREFKRGNNVDVDSDVEESQIKNTKNNTNNITTAPLSAESVALLKKECVTRAFFNNNTAKSRGQKSFSDMSEANMSECESSLSISSGASSAKSESSTRACTDMETDAEVGAEGRGEKKEKKQTPDFKGAGMTRYAFYKGASATLAAKRRNTARRNCTIKGVPKQMVYTRYGRIHMAV